jgi:hypothetical protein
MTDLYIGPIEFTPAGPPTSLVHVTNPDLHRFPRFERAMALARGILGPVTPKRVRAVRSKLRAGLQD